MLFSTKYVVLRLSIVAMVKNTHSFTASFSTQKVLWWILKLVITIVSGWYLYHTLFVDDKFRQTLPLTIRSLSLPHHGLLLAIAILLIFFNWGFESWKWHVLIRKFQDISWWRSYKAIFAGTAISWWMPNRAGEYVGRIFFIRAEKRIKGILATFIGSVSQLMVTIILGILGLLAYCFTRMTSFYLCAALAFMGILCIAMLFIFYFNINQLRYLLPDHARIRFLRKYALVYALYRQNELQEVLSYSLLRYLVFSVQFYILLQFYGIDIPIPTAAMLIFLTFFIQTAIPSTGFGELAVRGGTAAFLFQSYSHNLSGIIAASYTLWIINVLLPGLIGGVILVFARINRKWSLQ
jgi:hypothetical protein